jgi:transposase
VISGNRCLTVQEVADEVGISIGSYHKIFTGKRQMRRVGAKLVPRAGSMSLLIRSYLAKHQTSVVPQPPYSPDLAPADCFLFPKLETILKRRRFQAIE